MLYIDIVLCPIQVVKNVENGMKGKEEIKGKTGCRGMKRCMQHAMQILYKHLTMKPSKSHHGHVLSTRAADHANRNRMEQN